MRRLRRHAAACRYPGPGRVRPGGLPGLILTLALAALGAACQETVTTSDGRAMPAEVRPPPTVPSSARASRMLFMVEPKPQDQNNNGYPDLIRASVMLFAHPHPTPLWEDGSFTFTLKPEVRGAPEAVVPIATWRISGGELEAARLLSGIGPTYQFRLSLLEKGTDQYPLIGAELSCVFEPMDGRDPIRSAGSRGLQIGNPPAGGM